MFNCHGPFFASLFSIEAEFEDYRLVCHCVVSEMPNPIPGQRNRIGRLCSTRSPLSTMPPRVISFSPARSSATVEVERERR